VHRRLHFHPAIRPLESETSNPFVRELSRWDTPQCVNLFKLNFEPKPFCVSSHLDQSPQILVIGDSHANHWMPGIIAFNPDTPILQIGS
jgi:hypothetical protein